MKHSTTWIDLTDMIGWTGQHGGTQRVVYGIAEEYYLAAQKDASIHLNFFAFDSRSKKFFIADFEQLRKTQVEVVTVDDDDASSAKPSKKALIKHLAIKYAPGIIRNNPKLRRRLKGVAKKAYHQARNAKHAIRGRQHIATVGHGMGEAEFNANDRILLLGKPWDTPTMVPTLERLKEERGFKIVAVIYDLIISLYPHLHSPLLFKAYTQYMFDIAQCADLVLPISKSSEKDFFRFCDELQLPRPKSKVIRIADIVENLKSKKPNLPYGFAGEAFVLCVGTIEVRKNHNLLYYVYKLAQERNIHLPKLIIVGRKGWNATDTYNLIKNDQDIAKNVLILESVNDNELEWLYKHCELTIYPSMYEGWGLPVAESLQRGKIAVASKSSSIPEIAGDLLEYFSPYSADECLHLLIKYLEEPRKQQIERAISAGYHATTWRNTYEQVLGTLMTFSKKQHN